MLKEMWGKVSKFVKRLFAKKATAVELSELVKRVEALEQINKQRAAAKQKNYNNKLAKKQNA